VPSKKEPAFFVSNTIFVTGFPNKNGIFVTGFPEENSFVP